MKQTAKKIITGESIALLELIVHSLDGAFYGPTRAYLEKYGVKWKDVRDKQGALQEVRLTFPSGTMSKQTGEDEKYERYQIALPNNGLVYWNIHKVLRYNQIIVPYAYIMFGENS